MPSWTILSSRGDPRWIYAKFNSRCPCGRSIRKGDRTFYFPNGRVALCAAETCGQKSAAEFYAARADEDFANA